MITETDIEIVLEAELQIRYLHEKFQETGSGNATISRLQTLASKLKEELDTYYPENPKT